MTILQEIFDNKRREVTKAMERVLEPDVVEAAAHAPPALDFAGALRAACEKPGFSQIEPGAVIQRGAALIAEVKAASPSKGVLVRDFDPLRLAEIYVENGAAALSILTDERYFKGSLEDLRRVRARFPEIPVLRKDFVFHPYQVYEARAAGADAVLLIAAMLEAKQLAELHSLAAALGMTALVEVHTAEELQTALQMTPQLIGINNRDLHSFRVSLGNSLGLIPLIPPTVTVVAESGISSRGDVLRLSQAGAHAVLVGEALVTASDIAHKVRELVVHPQIIENNNSRRKYCEG